MFRLTLQPSRSWDLHPEANGEDRMGSFPLTLARDANIPWKREKGTCLRMFLKQWNVEVRRSSK